MRKVLVHFEAEVSDTDPSSIYDQTVDMLVKAGFKNIDIEVLQAVPSR